MSEVTHFLVERKYDGTRAFSKTTLHHGRNLSKTQREGIIDAIELSEYGAASSLNFLIELYRCGGLQNSVLYRATEPPKPVKDKEGRSREWNPFPRVAVSHIEACWCVGEFLSQCYATGREIEEWQRWPR